MTPKAMAEIIRASIEASLSQLPLLRDELCDCDNAQCSSLRAAISAAANNAAQALLNAAEGY